MVEPQEELLRITLASIGDAVISTDLDGKVTNLNRVAASLTGWPEPAAIGRPLDEVFRIINGDTRRPVDNPALRALREGTVVGLANNTILISRDGTERWIDDSAAPILDRAGKVGGCVLVFRDVTQRRKAELALRRSERELAELFENATVGIHLVSPEGTILRANQYELELLGYPRSEYVGRQVRDFHVDPAVADEILEQLRRGDTLRRVPSRIRRKDGAVIDVLINANGLFEDGRFVRGRVFVLDVTELRRAERTRALLAAIVADSDDAIASKDVDGIVLSWNAGAERLFGYTAAEMIGTPIRRIIPPELQTEEDSILARLRRGERIDHYETVRLAKDGRRLDVSLTVSPIQDESGRIIGASKVARDISGRKRAEEAIRQNEQRFRELANNIDQLVWTCDEHGHASWYNDRWYAYTGSAPEEVFGDGWRRFQHPDHARRVEAGFRESVRAGVPWEDTFPLLGKDGNFRWFLSRAVPIRDESGTIVRWLGTNTDVTRQRELEEALRRADRRKDEFLATLAHELRNPLAPLRNALEIMKRTGDAEGELRRARDTMERQLAQMVRLVDDLLDISRITRDRLELRREPVELRAVVEQAIETAQALAAGKEQVLSVEVPDDALSLDADPVRITQVFDNLLHNAVKFTASGGRIELAVEQSGNDVVISVKDDGIGLPPDRLESIFEMFTQVEETVGRSEDGLGIGLTLVKRLVEMHGGTVEAKSKGLGQGSEFAVRLPLLQDGRVPRAAPLERPAAPPPTAGSRRRVLIVDDNRDSADSLATLLRLEGHDAAVAYEGREAIAVAERLRPEVVLLDIGLPDLTGLDVCRKIRETGWGAHTVIVALTGWGQAGDLRRSREAGFDRHMVKPADLRSLTELLASLPGKPSEAKPPARS